MEQDDGPAVMLAQPTNSIESPPSVGCVNPTILGICAPGIASACPSLRRARPPGGRDRATLCLPLPDWARHRQGRFEFNGLLKVEGRFEGVLRPLAGANMIVSKSGVVVGDIEGFNSVVVEGSVIGNVSAAHAELRRNAFVDG